MAGRRGRAQGGVIRTYGRLRSLRRAEPQKWLSPEYRKHLFSSSSSHPDSSIEPSSPEDPDFIPSKKASVSCRRGNLTPESRTFSRKKKKKKKKKCLQPPRKSRRKSSSTRSNPDEKENDERFHASSQVVFSTPFRKFVTIRRKAPGPGVAMKPLSSKRKREAISFMSLDSCGFEADSLTLSKKRKMCTDMTDLLSTSAETLHSPLQKPPLLSSTPSMMLTAMPRKGDAFVRQLALSEPLEDSIVICCPDCDFSSDANERAPSPCRGHPGRRTRPQSEDVISHEERSKSDAAPTSSKGCSTKTMEYKTHKVKSIQKEKFGDGPGSGVKRLIIKASRDRRSSSVCLMSPLMVSSPESPSVVFIGEGKLKPGLQDHGDEDVFGVSAELFSHDFTFDKEETVPTDGADQETKRWQPGSHNSMVRVLKKECGILDCSPSTCYLSGFSPKKWKYFSKKQFQPFVRLNSQVVTDYFRLQQKSKDLLNKSSDHRVLPETNRVTPPMKDIRRMKPSVSLASASVTKYFLKKDEASEENTEPLPRSEESAVLSSCSPTFQNIAKTSLITTSVLKNKGPDPVAPQTVGTGRKVCISGFSAKRWGTLRKNPASAAQQQLSFHDRSREDLGVGDSHSSSILFSSSLLTTSFMNSTAVKNLNISTECLTGQNPQKEHQRWARLRAALSLHRRKKVEAESPIRGPVKRRNGGKMCLSSRNSSLLLLSPFQSPLCTHELTDAEKVFAECQQDQPVPFSQCLTQDELSHCQKVGEGVYGEVFRTLRGGQHVALKVIPIEGSQKVNGENQKSFAEILPEIIISKELSLLNEGEDNQTGGFIQLHSAHTVQGSYPPELLSAWDRFSEEKGTENERPDLFGSEQLFMILEFEFGGDDLERISSKLPSVAASRSILHQVTAALAVAEAELRFEHRDLHWGNLLIEKNTSCTLSVSLHGEMIDIPSARIQVKIIDYTLSRLDKDGLTVFCDLSTDEELFLGEGDLQFDVYRSMRQENQNVWSSYKPHSNVLWLHYLCDKLLSEVRYIKKPTSAPQRRVLSRLQDFRREVLQFGSATEVLKRSRLFK